MSMQNLDLMLSRLARVKKLSLLRQNAHNVIIAWHPCVVIRMRNGLPPQLFRGERNAITGMFRETSNVGIPIAIPLYHDITTLEQAKELVGRAEMGWIQFNAVLAMARERVRELVK